MEEMRCKSARGDVAVGVVGVGAALEEAVCVGPVSVTGVEALLRVGVEMRQRTSVSIALKSVARCMVVRRVDGASVALMQNSVR